jgi:hypothetical protein
VAAQCPAHGDSHPSLAVTEAQDLSALLYCHFGCTMLEVVTAIDLKPAHLFPSSLALWEAAKKKRALVVPTGRASVDTDDGADDALDPVVSQRLCAMYGAALGETADPRFDMFAAGLGLTPASLRAFGVGLLDGCLIIPELDSTGTVVGLLRRTANGKKVAVAGSRRGLVIPLCAQLRPVQLHVAEGATDAFALHAAGLMVVGRPAARGSRAVCDWLARLGEMINAPEVIVLGDRDAKPDRRWPGLDGAVTLTTILRARLRCPVRWALPMPPYKDAREQFVDGAIDRGFCVGEVLP